MITYNHEKFIQKAIDGILMQEVDFDYEIIIGDDCSEDKTVQICEKYNKIHDNIRLLPRDKKYGVAKNFIRTLEECKGKYIALCEGDDYWTDKYKLKRQVSILEKNMDCVICFHNVMIEKKGVIIGDYITRKVPIKTSINNLIKGNYIHTLSCVFRRAAISTYPEEMNNVIRADYFLFLMLAKKGYVMKVDEIMGIYRVHDNGVMSSMSRKNKIRTEVSDLMIIYDKVDRIYLKYTVIIKIIKLIIKNILLR